MRITKIIKNRIEKAVESKYYDAYDKIGKDYEKMHNAYCEEIEELRKQTEEKALAIASKYGFIYHSNRYRGIVTIDDNANDPEQLEVIRKARENLYNQKENILEQIYFDLEVGETDKSELKNVLESISF